MKTLYLVRHAKSSWKDSSLDDEDRPLNKRGKRDAPKMGERLAKRNVFPDLMITSPAVRARTTCEVIADVLEYPEGEIEENEDVYLASEGELLSLVQRCDNLWNTVMIFGHNPGFTEFANSLADEDIDNIPTCGVFACTFDVDDWSEVDFGKGEMILFDYPKKEFKPL
ncbi:MAG: SixA phosphatase family protein [Candidatus Cyclobacteriaceae bacterium M2_1C_046]